VNEQVSITRFVTSNSIRCSCGRSASISATVSGQFQSDSFQRPRGIRDRRPFLALVYISRWAIIRISCAYEVVSHSIHKYVEVFSRRICRVVVHRPSRAKADESTSCIS
jgi:hypothetical protein